MNVALLGSVGGIYIFVGLWVWFFQTRGTLAGTMAAKILFRGLLTVSIVGVASGIVLGDVTLGYLLSGKWGDQDIYRLVDSWMRQGPLLMLVLTFALYWGILKRATPETIDLIPARVVKWTCFYFLICAVFGMLNLHLQGLLEKRIILALPAHLSATAYCVAMLVYDPIDQIVRQQTQKNYSSLRTRLFLNTVCPIVFTVVYMGDFSYLLATHEHPSQLTLVLRIVLCGSLLVGLFGYTMRRTTEFVMHPLQELAGAVEQISSGDGDLTRRLMVDSRDEFGRLVALFNRFLKQVHQIVKNIVQSNQIVHTNAKDLVASGQKLSEDSTQVAQSLEREGQAIKTLTHNIGELDRSIQAISGNAGETAHLAQSVDNFTQQAEDEMQEVVRGMEAIQESAQKINQILGDIQGIARQTNLLSLNAAIEAAKAGQQGRGFAVVAVAVRDLAGRSTNATKSIQNLIKESNERIAHESVIVERVAAVLDHVKERVQASRDNILKISEATQAQSQFVHRMHEDVNTLDDLAVQNMTTTTTMHQTIQQQVTFIENLSREVQTMHESVSQFKVS